MKGLYFDDFVAFSLEETCKNAFQNILNGSTPPGRCLHAMEK